MAKRSRRIVVTGVSRGLGAALVGEFAAAGHAVAGCARDAAAIEALTARHGAPHHFRAVDVSSDGQVAAWAEAVLAEFGTPDLLIANAAIITPNAPLWETSEADFQRLTDININGVHRVLRAFLPAMIRAGEGVAVTLSSGWGRSVSPMVAPYCASKWAIEGMTRALAEELPPGMAAVTLNPGIIDTQMLQSTFGDAAAGHRKPEEWARSAAPFLLGLSAKDNGRPLTAP